MTAGTTIRTNTKNTMGIPVKMSPRYAMITPTRINTLPIPKPNRATSPFRTLRFNPYPCDLREINHVPTLHGEKRVP
jgi:hypothetical protein